jgi:hypothetical protein
MACVPVSAGHILPHVNVRMFMWCVKRYHYAGAPLPRTRVDPKQSIPVPTSPSRRQGTLPARRNDR